MVVAVAGVALSVFAWSWRHRVERAEFNRAFAAECENLRALASRELSTHIRVLDSIRQLHTISEHISDDDFREFVEKGMLHQRAVLGAFGFARVITAAERASYENPSAADRQRSASIVERGPDGGLRPAGQRPQYFPLTYETPDGGLGVPRGFDLGSGAAEQAAILRMAQSGGFALGGRGWGPSQRACLALAPIFYFTPPQGGQPAAGFMIGFACGLLDPAIILEPVIRQAESRGLEVHLIDAPPETRADDAGPTALNLPLPVVDQVWTFRCVALGAFKARYHTAQPALFLAAGLVVTALLCLQLLVLARRAASIESTVRERTADLRDSHARLEREMAERRRLEQEVLDVATAEKQRVGRDLHDSLGQKLTGATYLSRTLAEELAADGSPHGGRAAQINEVLKEAVAQSRRIARGLSPVDLSEGGLAEALRHLAKETSGVFGIDCVFHGDHAPFVAAGTAASNLYQIAQEAVNNAIKHGRATEIAILLDGESGAGELVVEDNGGGLPVDAATRGGMGLRIMRYRAGVIGGELKIEPGREGGTVVVCRFPLLQPPA